MQMQISQMIHVNMLQLQDVWMSQHVTLIQMHK